jgi:hypothetical protein
MAADGDRIGQVAARVRSRDRVRGHRSEAAVGLDNQHLVMASQSSAGARRQAGDLVLLGLAVRVRDADLAVEASTRGGENSCRGSARRRRRRGPAAGPEQQRRRSACVRGSLEGAHAYGGRGRRPSEWVGRVEILTRARLGRNGPVGPSWLWPTYSVKSAQSKMKRGIC